MTDQFFEMLWDCEACSARELLAKAQRHCPMCGAAQDPKHRYFPKPGQEVEAQGHRFVGVDWACGYCESPNSAAAAFCANCGGPKDGTKNVALIQEKPSQDSPASASGPAGPASPSAVAQSQPGRPSGFPWMKGIAGFVILLVAVLAFLFFSKHDETVHLAEKTWSRSIDVEQFASVRDSAWCDAMPADAYQVLRSREQRSTRQVEAGQSCVDVRSDQGDGTFTKRRECSTRYRNEPVFDAKCSYRINRWQTLRTDRLAGGSSLMPAWPAPLLGNALVSGNSVGAERLGQRQESYRVKLKDSAGKEWTCDLDAGRWMSLMEGQPMNLKVRATGGADCATLAVAR